MTLIKELSKADVTYYQNFVEQTLSNNIFNYAIELFNKEERHTVTIDNKTYKLSRKTIVFIDKDIDKSIIPKIWGLDVTILPFTEDLLKLKETIEKETNFKFNICLANYYSTGKREIKFHSDREEKGSISCIASISIGASRKFYFRNIGEKTPFFDILLETNSLLVMGKNTQESYEHALLSDKLCHEPRLNLTFRLFDNDRYIKY